MDKQQATRMSVRGNGNRNINIEELFVVKHRGLNVICPIVNYSNNKGTLASDVVIATTDTRIFAVGKNKEDLERNTVAMLKIADSKKDFYFLYEYYIGKRIIFN